MPEEKLQITVTEKQSVTAVVTPAEGEAGGWVFVYAPSAGANIHDPFGRYACRELAASGFIAVRFQFPYMEAGRRSPDRTSTLEATWRAAIDAARPLAPRLVVGGRSMGGRIASHVIAQNVPVDALALFAYPLHSPAKPDVWRDSHLPAIAVPTLFSSGTRDSFASPDELRRVAATMPSATVHRLEGADHGFSVLKSSGRTRQDVWEEAVRALVEWLANV